MQPTGRRALCGALLAESALLVAVLLREQWRADQPHLLAELPVSGQPGIAAPRRLTDLQAWEDEELQRALEAIQRAQLARLTAPAADPLAPALLTPAPPPPPSLPSFLPPSSPPAAPAPAEAHFRYVHKHTYATGDPKAAAYFMASYFGGWCNHEPGHGFQQTHCNKSRFEEPMTWNVYYDPTEEHPKGFSIHFVKNPHKLPQQSPMNASELGEQVERWRGNFSATGVFDQFMDNHLGLVFDSLDPLVEKWQRDGVPFTCRTWCCGPGMRQYPDGCPLSRGSARFNTRFCEQGCYVEVPHGIIVEALCGLEGYNASRNCLTKADSQLKVFDLCSDN